MNKTDLRIRPIYHRLRNRIEAHICISFVAYSILLELERILKRNQSQLSLKQAEELTKRMYQIKIVLPSSGKEKILLISFIQVFLIMSLFINTLLILDKVLKSNILILLLDRSG